MIKSFLFTTIVISLCLGQRGKEYRFDYKFSKAADGWLKLHHVPSIWQEARLRCHAEGAVLASPLTKPLRTAILEHVAQDNLTKPMTIYTGIHSFFSKGDYHSVEGVPLSKIPLTWVSGQPDNYANEEGCLVMLTQGEGPLADVKCSDPFPYVCYKKNTRLVISECGTSDPEYKLDARTGSCYKFHRRALPWSRAFMICAGEGAHLAVINSEKESQVLRDLYAKNPDNLISTRDPAYGGIGFHDWGEHGSWMTIHGETLYDAGFSTFQPGQPDNSTRDRTGDKGEYCGSIFRTGYLNDIWCNVPIPFFCEMKPNTLIPDTDE